ncbi:unnamed protein product [Prorocentrum cordatum]|uniref:HMG box domain-containing protein n=1 Tax=Prorocentrum cordatum TaxID=2364126 RepID=A0ABN9Q8R4_9DINO|nr:unnamed protein product [Polarella glacialis]
MLSAPIFRWEMKSEVWACHPSLLRSSSGVDAGSSDDRRPQWLRLVGSGRAARPMASCAARAQMAARLGRRPGGRVPSWRAQRGAVATAWAPPRAPAGLRGPLWHAAVGLPLPPAAPGPALRPDAAWLVACRALAAQRRVDPDKPKRPVSAYMRFLSDFRSQKSADLGGKDLLKAAGAEWKALPAERRKPYEAAYEKEAVAYRSAYDQYVSSGKKDAFKRDPDKPKRPLTGFLRFVAEKREQNKDVKATVLTKEASDSWKGMSEAQRKPYNEAYELDKARYAEKMKAYAASGKEEESGRPKSASRPCRRSSRRGRPPGRPRRSRGRPR